MKRRSFTLLEILVAVAIMAMAASAIGWNLHRLILKKRFQANEEKLRSRFFTCRRLALNTQADWRCKISWNGKGWSVEAHSDEHLEMLPLPPLKLDSIAFSLDGEKKKALVFDFSSSGEILPKGRLRIQQIKGTEAVEWKIPDLFNLEEGKLLGPVHPSEVKKKDGGATKRS